MPIMASRQRRDGGGWMTTLAIADEYDVSERTVRRWISSGDLPAYRNGRLLRVKRDDVERLFHRIPTTGGAA